MIPFVFKKYSFIHLFIFGLIFGRHVKNCKHLRYNLAAKKVQLHLFYWEFREIFNSFETLELFRFSIADFQQVNTGWKIRKKAKSVTGVALRGNCFEKCIKIFRKTPLYSFLNQIADLKLKTQNSHFVEHLSKTVFKQGLKR